MTGTVDERLAAALHSATTGCAMGVWQDCKHEPQAARILSALADSGVVLVDEDRLTEALYSFHSWEPETARSEAGAIMRALRESR